MPVKRRNPKDRRFVVSPETLALWRTVKARLAEHGQSDEEYSEASTKLCLAVGLSPWDFLPQFVRSGEPPAWVRGQPDKEDSWRRAWAMRQAFEKAARQAEAAEAAAKA